jgi:hypothetical protein
LVGFEIGRARRCCRKGDFSGIGGGGVEGGGEAGPGSIGVLKCIGGLGIGGLGIGGGRGLPVFTVAIIGYGPGTDGGV